MPIHDWTRVDAGLFHAFHQSWIVRLCDALNAGGLPQDYFALPEQSIRGPIPDVLTLRLSSESSGRDEANPCVAVAVEPPRARVVRRLEQKVYARKASRITIRHRQGQIVAVMEIVSPGYKASRAELRAFVEKTSDLVERGVHLLVIDLFPPTKRDPQGIHKLIWDELEDEDFELPADKPLILAAYEAGPDWVAYVEPVAVGDDLPDMPLFLRSGFYVPTPLESTYQATWSHFPAALKGLLESPSETPSDEP
jgi:hypothetical protein